MSNDKVLKQAVLDELQWEPSVNAAHIGVSAKDGIVTLMGHVESYFEKSAAEQATRKVSDVKGVAEEIEVRLPSDVKHGDEDIAAAAIDRLKWSSTIPRDAVKVTVEKGWVTLTGEVEWHYQQNAATNDVRELRGVVGVSNKTTLRPKPDVSNIKEKIVVALHRSWLDPANIDVSAHGGTVKLTGKVRSLVERDEADAAAWASPGTVFVENNISVS
jgi:osmotically-inducible protein OsmY